MRRRFAVPALAAVLCAATLLAALVVATPAAAEVTLSIADERPLRGEVVRLRVESDGAPAAGHLVVAEYRPNSQTGYEEELVVVDGSGSVLWTPLEAGPTRLHVWPPGADRAAEGAAAVATHTIAVRYGGFPASGLLIMVLAGLLLFGGAASALVLLLRPDREPPPEPPST